MGIGGLHATSASNRLRKLRRFVTRLINRTFVVLFFANTFQSLSFFLFVHFPRFVEELGGSEVVIGFLVGATAVSSIAARPVIGPAADRRGRRPLILLGFAINIVAIAAYFAVEGLGVWITAIRILHGIGEATLFTTLFTLAADIVPADRRTQALTLFGVSGVGQIAFGGIIGDWALASGGFDRLFGLALIFAVAGLLLVLAVPATPASTHLPRPSFFAASRNPRLIPIWVATLVFSLGLTPYFAFLATFVSETGLGSVGGFFAAYAFVAVGLRLMLSWLPDRVGPKRVLFASFACLASGLMLLGLVSTDRGILLAGALCGMGHGFIFPILYAMTIDRAKPENRGSAMALYTGLFDVAAFVGAPALGFVIQQAGYPSMWITSAAVVAVGAAIFAGLDRRPSVTVPGAAG